MHEERRDRQANSACGPGRTPPASMGAEVYTHVVAALSLGSNDLWQQLSSLVVEELIDYAQLPTFGVRRVLLAGLLTSESYPHCSAHGDDLYISHDVNHGLSVYRDGALQRHISTEVYSPTGIAVVDDAVFVGDRDADCVCVYARASGAPLRRFGSRGSGPGELEIPHGLAAYAGRVCVIDSRGVSVFTENGAFSAHVRADAAWGVAADERQVFVGCTSRLAVRVYRAENMSLERLIGEGSVRNPVDACVDGGVLFVADVEERRRVLAFDVATSAFVASLGGFASTERPYGVAVGADGTLFVTTRMGWRNWRLWTVQPL